jgi:protocatechuate 3,4-dioxygenase beta subunit
MSFNRDGRVTRRQVTALIAVTGASLLMPHGTFAAAQLVPTPMQTAGPFYPVNWLGDIDNDLVRVVGKGAPALGHVTHIRGHILDVRGQPIVDAVVEIWQCDTHGRYFHPSDRVAGGRDTGFQGRGRTRTDAAGRYRFRTIRPVAYTGRTPHIHFSVVAPDGRQIVTQMYVAGEAANARDVVLRRIPDRRQRDRIVVALAQADGIEPGALSGRFDIVFAD